MATLHQAENTSGLGRAVPNAGSAKLSVTNESQNVASVAEVAEFVASSTVYFDPTLIPFWRRPHRNEQVSLLIGGLALQSLLGGQRPLVAMSRWVRDKRRIRLAWLRKLLRLKDPNGEDTLADLSYPIALAPPAEPNPLALVNTHIQHEQEEIGIAPSINDSCALLDATPESVDQDRHEIAFFLRYFSEEPARWMDVCSDHPYFSEQVVLLSSVCPLVRYAAVALAAKQLGYMKNPECAIRQTRNHRFMLQAFSESSLDFLCYGAKYYDKAIQILAQHLSHEERCTSQLSPYGVYQTGLTPQSNDLSVLGDHDSTATTLQVLAACILCQYEDLSATMRAWAGHLHGIYKLLRPYLSDTMNLPTAVHVPQPMKAMNAVFWFFALNDMLDAYVNKRNTRLDFRKIFIWRRMGLPLDDSGYLMPGYIDEAHAETILFKALIRLMCQLVNSDLGNSVEWNAINEQFDRWQAILPLSFSSGVSWPHFAGSDNAQQATPSELSAHESWFPKDACAISMAFYHMARMLLLIHRPVEAFLRQSQNNPDLLTAYHTLQQDLRRQAMEIIAIARGAPNSTVRKYLLQPLYVAGRCLADTGERQELLDILQQIDDDLGVFTDYRQKDLSEEWGIPYKPAEKDIVP
ncbi:hypothetical protein ANOM_001999 [Aspergillus nomiae NRRL 13137]|uniref:Zn(II)2Cys6 transcription factor n=1 Tax=Aspergillus nomiae NRRL (strain ATCC 15546 / NRRL 13137 / CBS 260.88 / M93) TaxID=1509407 RepID=A0A0L1JD78_ASPN3|nr:uncharacterized protein ANOM_001999 [Aspergillus nomiae NRRL 13137]KNG89739.1 hypothetical protein ANOM_001999 [Aspergillus nomiae NRRL 13137]